MKKILAAIMALCIVGGAMPAVYSGAPESVITASASDYEEVVDGVLTYHVYADHAELTKCDVNAEGKIVIPDKVNGVTVTKINEYAFQDCESLTSVTIPDSVTSIGFNAFFASKSLTSITIPASVTNIDEGALCYCASLKSIDVSEENQFYSSIDGVLLSKDKTQLIQYPAGREANEYAIPNSVTNIGYQAFCDNNNLLSVIIPDSVTSIGFNAFIVCRNLSSITIPDSVTNIEGHAFDGTPWLETKMKENPLVIVNGILIDGTACSGDVVIPDSVTSIGGDAFHNCENLTSITIPDSVTSIGFGAFDNCENLTSINIPVSVTEICSDAFYNCSSLTSIKIPDSVKSIEQSTFHNCSALTTITIPASVTSISDNAFANCSSLTSITIMNPECYIYDWTSTIANGYDENNSKFYYNGTIYGYTGSTAQVYAEKYGYKFESIGKVPAFEGEFKDGPLTYQVYKDHAELTKCDESAEADIVIPEKVKGVPVTSIGRSAFSHCENLTSVTIPNSVKSIGGRAFEYCSNLKTITIPTSVTSISGGFAFEGTPWLKSKQKENPLVVVNGILIDGSTCSGAVDIPDSVKVIGHSAFWGCENITSVVIPDTVTIIDVQSFYNCTNLTSVTIPDSVRKINTFAFEDCKSLKSITLPASVNSIWFSAFVNCTSLTSATIMNPNCEIYDAPETFSNGTNELGYYFNGTISGYEGSTAQKYANKYGYKFQAINKSEEVVYPKTTEGFVTRMYNVALNRNPDAAGLKNWVTKLNNHTATAADIINGFFFSSEYQKKNRTADQMIEDCYKAMLDRSPDASGRANWKNRLSVGMSIQAICKGFVGSSEFKGLCDYYKITPGSITPKYARDENYERTYFIYRLYKNCLGRNPSASEVENWCKQIKAGKTGSSIAYGFIFSKEYKGKNVSNSAFVDMLYRTILGRGGDSSGVKSWTAKLNAKATRESVFNGFLFSTEFKNQCDKAGIKVGSKV